MVIHLIAKEKCTMNERPLSIFESVYKRYGYRMIGYRQCADIVIFHLVAEI